MTTLLRNSNWNIKMWGNEHPPVHVHVLHPDGDASIDLEGVILNRGVPARVIAQALAWVMAHEAAICTEWTRLNNPDDRGNPHEHTTQSYCFR